MKKIEFNVRHWKIKKKPSFTFWFTLATVIIALLTAIGSFFIVRLLNRVYEDLEIPDYVMVVIITLVSGILLSFLVGLLILLPINRLKEAMSEVTDGNLDVKVKEKSIFDEVEDMNHYFNMMMNELRKIETIQSDFVSNVSHEFKTPLNAIEGYLTLLSYDDISEEEKKNIIEKIYFNTQRMNELVNNVLLLSKIESNGVNRDKKLFSLDEQIRKSIIYLEPKWSKKGIELDVELDEIYYNENEGILAHVWNNLISNAIKFSPDGSKIKIELKVENEIIIFSVSDEGPGIDENNIDSIFRKFYQADTSHKQEGNGLGLSLVKQILDLYNGQIEVKNLEPKGCIFSVYLNK